MANITRGKTFISGETVEPADMHQLVDSATVTDIVDADVSASAAIALSKLATGALPTAITVASANIVDGTITSSDLATAVVNALVPPGAVMPFARATAPTGWLIANGDVVPNGSGTVQGVTADFSALHAALSTSFGTAGTLPDLRGIFVRGSGSQTISGTTYSGTFAAKQQDQFKSHTHQARWLLTNAGVGVGVGGWGSATAYSNNFSQIEPTGGTETRPANIALTYCIKF